MLLSKQLLISNKVALRRSLQISIQLNFILILGIIYLLIGLQSGSLILILEIIISLVLIVLQKVIQLLLIIRQEVLPTRLAILPSHNLLFLLLHKIINDILI